MKKIEMQLGKKGITDNFLQTLKTNFKNCENIKISILKNAGRAKEKTKDYAEEILKKLGSKYTIKIVGFTMFVKKWRKSVR